MVRSRLTWWGRGLFLLAVGAGACTDDGPAQREPPIERITRACAEFDQASDGTVERVWTFAHDAEGRNIGGTEAPSGAGYQATYDADGFQTTYAFRDRADAEPSYEEALTYDAYHRVTTLAITDRRPGLVSTVTIATTYDDRDRVVATTATTVDTPDVGAPTTTVVERTFAYGDADDPISGTLLRDGITYQLVVTRSADGRERTTATVAPGGGVVETLREQRDDAGRGIEREQRDDADALVLLQTWTYGPDDEVRTTTYESPRTRYATTYTYDADGGYAAIELTDDDLGYTQTYRETCAAPTGAARQ